MYREVIATTLLCVATAICAVDTGWAAESTPDSIAPGKDGSLFLSANGFAFGKDADARMVWKAMVQPGVYNVMVEYSAADCSPVVRLQLKDGRGVCVRLLQKGTMRSGDDGKPQTHSLGPLPFSEREVVELELSRDDAAKGGVVSVSAVVLYPIGDTQKAVIHPQVSVKPKLRTNDKDNAEMIWIREGEFTMGGLSGKDQHQVFLKGYWMYKLPVTVQQYRQFCESTKREMPSPPRWGWIDDHPMVNVSWYEALAYAKWAGVRLPSEAEWEKAGRGTDGRVLPWGNDFDTSKCQSPRDLHGFQGTSPVGYFPTGASPYGCLDMAGNVWQWCTSRIGPYPYRADDGREETDTYVDKERRTYRGGGFVMNSWRMDWVILHRGNYFPIEQDRASGKTIALRRDHIGFRCAASGPEPR